MTDVWSYSHYWNGVKFICGLAFDTEGKPHKEPPDGWGNRGEEPEIPRCPECQEVLNQWGGGL